eukprot:m.184762 g.184762  ORF g.184762 m.184762 type:complete len:50 (+) comp15562_c0_seq7:645-794(+)
MICLIVINEFFYFTRPKRAKIDTERLIQNTYNTGYNDYQVVSKGHTVNR